MFNIFKNNYELDNIGVNNVRGLTIDMINEANSGHPGICLGAASIIYTLYKRHMNIYLDDLDYVNRDRFIMSAGHGAPLLYSILYILDLLSLDDLKKLRQINSKTPGHPEYGVTPLVEMTTGPLGQGVASSVGIAMGESHLNKVTNGVIDYYTYVLCGDGELEEGVTYEALSLAGKLKLNKLILLYDYNQTTLDNKLNMTSVEDVRKRFESINFNVLESSDQVNAIDQAINMAKSSNLPSVIIVKTIIGKYSKNEGLNIVHGKPLDSSDIESIKQKLDLYNTSFTFNSSVKEDFKKQVLERGKKYYKEFIKRYNKLKNKEIIDKIINKEITYDLSNLNIEYNGESLRDLSGKILNIIANDFKLLIGGSADLSSSCKTNLVNELIFNEDYLGRNIYFGIREHAMASILNGLALLGLRPFGSTFLTFSDYMKPAIRMSSIMNLPVIYILTHDSVTVGEDGMTHEPIEQLLSLEVMPNLKVYRPYDLNELIGCYKDILLNKNPSVLVLPRDNKEISEYTKTSGVSNGIYVVKDTEAKEYVNLITNGEELGLLLKVASNLDSIGINTKVLSVPCMKNIKESDKEKLLKEKTIAITLGVPNYFYNLTNEVIGINTYGVSGKKEDVLKHFGFTEETLQSKIMDILNK